MAKSRYIFISGTNNFLDFSLNIGNVNLTGEEISVIGSSLVDAVFLRTGVSIDFSNTGASIDKLYLEGSYSDYSIAINGGILNLTRTINNLTERASISISTLASDIIIFKDGYASTRDIRNAINNGVVPDLNSTETSSNPNISVTDSASTILAVAFEPSIFATTLPNQTVSYTGSAGVDTVYIRPGAKLDLSKLGGENDLIYFSGSWQNYNKVVSNTRITFTRSNSANEIIERILVAANIGSFNDKLIFFDGQVFSNNAKNAMQAAEQAGLSADSVQINTIENFTSQVNTPIPYNQVSLSSNLLQLSKGQTASLTIQFGSDPIDQFSLNDFKVSGGSLTNIIKSLDPKTWTATFTPTDGILQGTATIALNAIKFYDKYGQQANVLLNYDTFTIFVSINAIASDNILTNSEQSNVIISGTSSLNSAINLVLGNLTKPATLTGTNWSYTLISEDLAALGQGNVVITARATDTATHAAAQATRAVLIDTILPTIVFDVVAQDNVVNASEKNTIIRGTISENNCTATLSFANTTHAVSISNFTWSYTLNSTDITNIGQGNTFLTLSATDAVGNIAQASKAIQIDTQLPFVTFNSIGQNNIINTGGSSTTLRGTVEANATVQIRLGSLLFNAVVNETIWSYTLTDRDLGFIEQNSQTLTAFATDAAHNIAHASLSVFIDAILPTVSINTIATDNIINASEQTSVITGIAESNTTLSLIFGGRTQNINLVGSSWSYTLNAKDIAAMGQGSEIISILATDQVGNIGKATSTIIVDTIAPLQTASILNASDNVGSSIGNIAFGGYTDDTTPTLSGILSANLTSGMVLAIYSSVLGFPSTRLGTATVNGTIWQFTPNTPLGSSLSGAEIAAANHIFFNQSTNAFYQLVSSDSFISWEYANIAASSALLLGIGGHLVNIDSALENNYINQTIAAAQAIWIGASDKQTEGAWHWYKNQTMTSQFWQGNSIGNLVGGLYHNWSNGEPNDGAGANSQDYAYMKADGTWGDLHGTTQESGLINPTAYVIEWDASKVLAYHFQARVEDVAGNIGLAANTYDLNIVADSAVI